MHSPSCCFNYKLRKKTTLTITGSHVCEENKSKVTTINKKSKKYEKKIFVNECYSDKYIKAKSN